jgi:PIN domain nuclease of toxin-antitoxin system
MNVYVTDTHSLYWYLTDTRKLPKAALRAFEEGENGLALIYVPTIALCEMWMMNDAYGRVMPFDRLLQLVKASKQFITIPLEIEDVELFDQFSVIPNDHDRIIAIAAYRMDAALITSDMKIRESKLVRIIW